MNTLAMQETEVAADAELVALCRQGDRDAFGRIVERYQSLVCALAYSACGDLARSEDLAQETFLVAWRQLAALQEPAKLKGWLCGIAKNLTRNLARCQARNPLSTACSFEEDLSADDRWELPSDQLMSKEEEAILWRVLETLPPAYRDPLVLFYRSGDSTVEVASALGLSEEAVRQRLARGRAMLDQRVTRLVESGLRRSSPTAAFTAAVLGALPLTSGQAAVAGSSAAASVPGAGALKASASGLFSALASVIPVAGGLLGLWGHIENSRSQRERRFLALSSLGLFAWALAWTAGFTFFLQHGFVQFTTRLSDAIALSLLWLGLAAPLDAYVIWTARRQLRIRERAAEGVERPIELARRGYRLSMYGATLAMTFGTTQWLFVMAHSAQDWVTLGGLTLLGIAGWLLSARHAVKEPKTRGQTLSVLWSGLATVSLFVVNLRWGAWHNEAGVLAPVGLNLLILVGFGSVRIGWFLKQRLLTVPSVRHDTVVALTIYAVVMMAGVTWFRAVRSAEVPAIQIIQAVTNDFQPDGTIRFQSVAWAENDSSEPLRESRFVNSDFVHVERVVGPGGQPLPFQVEHRDKTFYYVVRYTNAVPARRINILRLEGYTTGQISRLGSGEQEYHQQHWPANGVNTLRSEIYRLPSGARLLETKPADMTRRQVPDGRLELHTSNLVPPNGSVATRIRYLPQLNSP